MERMELMLNMMERITECRECDLRKAYDSPVPCAGSITARVMLIGEAPGADEVDEGKPFVGRSGQLLRSTIKEVGIDLSDLFVTNTILCRPPNNSFPKEMEPVFACRHWLVEQFDFVRPKFVVALGGKAHKHIGEAATGITTAVGIWKQWTPPWSDDRVWYMATLHPSFCLRGPSGRTSNAVMEMTSEQKKGLLKRTFESLKERLDDEAG